MLPLSKKENTNKITGLQSADQPEIFGRSKTREEIKAENAEEKRRLQQAQKEARAKAKAAKRAAVDPKKRRTDIIVLSVILGLVLVVLAVGLVSNYIKGAEEQKYDPEPSMSQFWKTDAKPQLSDKGLEAVVNRVYYTRGGYLCVVMTIGNGTAEPMHMRSLNVEIRNGQTEELIGGGYTEGISSNFTVASQDYSQYTFMISPEFVEIKDDPLSSISYSITAEGYVN